MMAASEIPLQCLGTCTVAAAIQAQPSVLSFFSVVLSLWCSVCDAQLWCSATLLRMMWQWSCQVLPCKLGSYTFRPPWLHLLALPFFLVA